MTSRGSIALQGVPLCELWAPGSEEGYRFRVAWGGFLRGGNSPVEIDFRAAHSQP
jgi:hypothetical protein